MHVRHIAATFPLGACFLEFYWSKVPTYNGSPHACETVWSRKIIGAKTASRDTGAEGLVLSILPSVIKSCHFSHRSSSKAKW